MPLPCHMSIKLSLLWFCVRRMGVAPAPFSFVFSDVFGSWWLQNPFTVLIFVPLENAQREVIRMSCLMSVLCKASVFQRFNWLAQRVCRISFVFLSTNTLFSVWLLLQWRAMVKFLCSTHSWSCHEGAQVVTKEHRRFLVSYGWLFNVPPSWQCLRPNLMGSSLKTFEGFCWEWEVLLGIKILWHSFC